MPVRMDFYPRPPRGGRQQPWTVTLDDGTISIHALREEGDRAALLGAGVSVSISIHALREEGDRSRRRPLQSQRRISIHALREEGDNFRPGTLKKYQAISIHALREEGDISQRLCFPVRLLFLSTPSARRATDDSQPDDETKGISIHALREEGDEYLVLGGVSAVISIHALREEGDAEFLLADCWGVLFLSTPSARRATDGISFATINGEFLSTPSARRATRKLYHEALVMGHFYPRPPRGGRPLHSLCLLALSKISIHALREEGDDNG